MLVTDQPGDAFLLEITYTDSQGISRDLGAQFVKRVNIDRGGSAYAVGMTNVPVGAGASNFAIRAWNIKMLGDAGHN